MLRLITFLLLASTTTAIAAPVKYRFVGFAERNPSGYGRTPVGANLGQLIPIVIVLDPATPATSVSGNTATYGGSCYNFPPPVDPIKSLTVNGKRAGPGCFDTVVVTSNPNGQSTLTINSASAQVGGLTITFATTSPLPLPTVAIPNTLDTLLFQYAIFNIDLQTIFIEGDMISK